MLRIENLTKSFGKKTAINNVSLTVDKGCLFGLVGSNGAGKSTLFRLLSGVYKPDSGSILYKNQPVWDNPAVKENTIFVADEPYLPVSKSIKDMASIHKAFYKNFDMARLNSLVSALKLDINASFSTFSKGMRRQAATALALSTKPLYLFLDETFDGLDIVMRGFIKQLIYEDMAERGTTVFLSSHSLKELEDCADRIVLLHQGSVVLDSDMAELKSSFFKVQIAFETDHDMERIADLEIRDLKKTGRVASFIMEGEKEEIEARLKAMNPLLLDVLPLSLEEVFVCSLGAIGYSYGEEL